MTTGFHPGDLVVVAARPSMGKTSFVLNIAQHVGTHTAMTVGFFSLEMSKEQLFMRMLTSEARIDAHRFRSGYPQREGLRQPLARAGHARGGPGVHRRHGVDRRPRDAREDPPAQSRARPGSRHHRLPPADAGARPVREPAAGSVGHLPVAQGTGQGAAPARSSRSRSSAAPPRGEPTIAPSCRTCASRAPSSRTPTSSSSSTGPRSTTRKTRSRRSRASPRSSSASSATARSAR